MKSMSNEKKEICRRAAKLANRRIREELLAETGEFSLVRRLALVNNTTVNVLRTSWNPLKLDTTAKSGFGYKLKIEADSLTMIILKDAGLYDRVTEIGIEAMQETMVKNAKRFVTEILDDLFEAPEEMKVEHKQSVAKPPRPTPKRKATA